MAINAAIRDFLESTRGQLLATLRRGPMTIEELTGVLGVTDNAVRAHLQVLGRDGLVRSAGVRRTEGAGKPANLYELTPAGDPLFSKAYLPMLEALLVAVSQLGPKAREGIIRSTASDLIRQAAPDPTGLPAKPLERAVAVLERLGAMVDVTRAEGGHIIQGHGCPVSLVTAKHPEVCQLVQLVLTDVTGRSVEEECDRGERCRCRFRVSDSGAADA